MQEAKRVKKVKVLNQVGISTVKGENSNGWGRGKNGRRLFHIPIFVAGDMLWRLVMMKCYVG
jgi:hypothetical protein